MSQELLVDRLRTIRDGLTGRGVTHSAVFGSRARDDARPDSDLDVLIGVAPGRKFSPLDPVSPERELADRTGLPVGLIVRRNLDPGFQDSIVAEPVEIF